jgi:release factor glutamine methyltransferase
VERSAVVRRLADAGCIAPDEEADRLLRTAEGDAAALDDLVRRRAEGEPLAWLTGAVTFCGLGIAVDPGVYVPRPQTEALARRAAAELPGRGVGVDLCTGCGAVAAVMSRGVPTAHVMATEIDPVAVSCARRNGIETFEGTLFEPLPQELRGLVDVVTGVLPYVPTEAIPLLPRDVQAFEPRRALDGGADGTVWLREAVHRAPSWLRPGGSLLLELGGEQADPIASALDDAGFGGIEVMDDEEGDPRAIVARVGVGRSG